MSADTEKLIADLRAGLDSRAGLIGDLEEHNFDDAIEALHSLLDRIATLEKSLAEAREALEPFAEAQGHFDGHVRDDDPVPLALRNIRAHHIRRAAALSNGGQG